MCSGAITPRLQWAVFKDTTLLGDSGAAANGGDKMYHLSYEMTMTSSLYFIPFGIKKKISIICVGLRSNWWNFSVLKRMQISTKLFVWPRNIFRKGSGLQSWNFVYITLGKFKKYLDISLIWRGILLPFTIWSSELSLSEIFPYQISEREYLIYSCYYSTDRSRDNDWLRAGRPRSRSLSPGRVKDFFHVVQPGSGVHPTSYPMGTGASFSGGGKAAGAWGWPLTSS
jgi:hypothetical protein